MGLGGCVYGVQLTGSVDAAAFPDLFAFFCRRTSRAWIAQGKTTGFFQYGRRGTPNAGVPQKTLRLFAKRGPGGAARVHSVLIPARPQTPNSERDCLSANDAR